MEEEVKGGNEVEMSNEDIADKMFGNEDGVDLSGDGEIEKFGKKDDLIMERMRLMINKINETKKE